MRRTRSLPVLLLASAVQAQYPLVQPLEIRLGQQRPSIQCIAQDEQGLLWLGTDVGLLRTDGVRTKALLRSDDEEVLAVRALPSGVFAAFSSGVLVRCTSLACDTLLADEELARYPITAIVPAGDGAVWLATHGAGLWLWESGGGARFGLAEGLPDLNVNDALAAPDGSVVVATDQGLASFTRSGRREIFGEEQGAPDNLVLALAWGADGCVLAGTDRAGVFAWQPGEGLVGGKFNDPTVNNAAVTHVAYEDGRIWTASGTGVSMHDTGPAAGTYREKGQDAALDLMVDEQGAVWWCTGNEYLHRAVPGVLVVPAHEGLDLTRITALCSDAADRIWFATPLGLFNHRAAFTADASVHRVALEVDPRTPVVSLAAQDDGTVWAATFGNGVHVVHPSGRLSHFTVADGLLNDNVLSVRCEGNNVVLGTLDGVCRYVDGRFQRVDDGSAGFVYDVLPLSSGEVLIATDGKGVKRVVPGSASATGGTDTGTYYSLVLDHMGGRWAAGPGTGLCALEQENVVCQGRTDPAFETDLYALGRWGRYVLVLGRSGASAFDPQQRTWTDVTNTLGLVGVEAELNAVCNDSREGLWFACSKGLMRLGQDVALHGANIQVVLTDVLVGTTPVDPKEGLETAHDRNDITFHFSGLHYSDPGGLRFEYRLKGYDTRLRTTTERQVSYAMLPPGRYTFQLRASVGQVSQKDGNWTEWSFTVDPPWYGRAWVQALLVLSGLALILTIIRTREARIRVRQRLEQDRIRYQLEALRSQVDPHFLFNSFNTLVELIESEPQRAVGHVDRLSEFFRSMLTLRDKELISLREELALLRTYFALERERFGEAVELVVELPEEVVGHRVVPLTLQLLMENALKHNTANTASPLRVEVTLKDGMVQVSNATNPRLTPPRSTGFGLHSIRQRYADLDIRPMVVDASEGRFVVRIPLIPPMQ